jgi:hypothetical protein
MLFLECTMVFKEINIKCFRKREKKKIAIENGKRYFLTCDHAGVHNFAHKATSKDPIDSYKCYSHVLSPILLSYLLLYLLKDKSPNPLSRYLQAIVEFPIKHQVCLF